MASSMARFSERSRASNVLEVWFEDGFSTSSPPRAGEEFEDVKYVGSFMKSSRSKRFYDLRSETRGGNFLQACQLCRRPLGEGDDIFMYRGDSPFCSEECRQEQIDKDEAEEKMWSSVKAMNKSKGVGQQMKKSPTKLHIRTGTVAAG